MPETYEERKNREEALNLLKVVPSFALIAHAGTPGDISGWALRQYRFRSKEEILVFIHILQLVQSDLIKSLLEDRENAIIMKRLPFGEGPSSEK